MPIMILRSTLSLASLLILLPLPLHAETALSVNTASPEADLAIEGSLNEIMIGGGTGMAARRITWRHRQLIMYPDWAIGGTRKGECRIQLMFNLTNLGKAPADKAFLIRFFNDGKPAGETRVEPLGAGESRVITTSGLFTEGYHWFSLRIDSDNVIAESDEANNEQKFDYTLHGRCKAGHRPRAAGG